MNARMLNQIIKEARGKKVLPLDQLDAVLEDDASYDRNVEKLNRYAEDFVVATDGIAEAAKPKARGPRSVPAYSAGENIYFQYVAEIRRKPRMTRREEQLFAKRMEFFKRRLCKVVHSVKLSPRAADHFLKHASCLGHPDSIDIGPLCVELGRCPRGKKAMVHANCQAYNLCRSVYVERNLLLVVNLTQPYRTYGIPIMDLIQEGNAALIRAVEKFDWRKQVRFQTYAAFWIRQAVERSISANKGIVRVPNYIQQKMRRFRREGKLPADKAAVSARDVSEAFEMSSEVAGHLLETERIHVSLDASGPGDDGPTLNDLVAQAPRDLTPADEIATLRQRLTEALDDLTEQERTIIKHRFGLDEAELKTLDELGEMMNVSRERVRQVQIRALQKLKKPRLLENLQSFL